MFNRSSPDSTIHHGRPTTGQCRPVEDEQTVEIDPLEYAEPDKEGENARAADAQEGMTAFLQKRPPNWVGH